MIQIFDRAQNLSPLKQAIDRFQAAHVLVVGDIIMDQYIWGHVTRISPEAPVPVVDVQSESKMLGGAANVIHNMATLGARPILCGIVGGDPRGQEVLELVEGLGLTTEGIVIEPGRPTSIKTRVVAQHQQMVRFDRETRGDIRPESIAAIHQLIKQRLNQVDAIVVSDYGKGVISEPLMKGLREMVHVSKDHPVIITVDPKTGNFEYYQGVDVITPNHHEAGVYCRFEIVSEEDLLRAGRHMIEELNCRSVLITRGKDGMTLFENGGDITHIPTVARKVFDVTGAGDTVISTFSLALAAGLDLKSAAVLSNFAAGIVVGEVGTTPIKAEDLKRVLDDCRPRP